MALTQDAWLNIEANSLAKTKDNPMYQGPNKFYLPGKGWVCSICSQWIAKLVSTICDHVNGIPAEKYWKTKLKLMETQWDSIEWQGFNQAHQVSGVTMQRWAVKYTLVFLLMTRI